MPAKKTKSKVDKKEKVSVIRFIYLYIITAVTFIVFIIGAVTIVDVVLKEFVFDIDDDYPARPEMICERHLQVPGEEGPNEDAYEKCIELQKQIEEERDKKLISDSAARKLSIGISQVAVGFPLWIFHWRIIERDRKKRKSGRTAR